MLPQLWSWLREDAPTIALIVLILSFVIQFTPIKINPWTFLLESLGKALTGSTCKKIDDLIKKIDTIENNVTENEKDRIRWEILDFANSCRNDRKHTRDEFQHIVSLNDKYKNLLEKTNDKNGVFEVEMKYIKDLYAEKLEKNDFLL